MYRHSSQIKANMYLTLSAILFTSILFHTVRKRERRVFGDKSRTLLTADERQRARSPGKCDGFAACCDTGRLLRPLLHKNRPKSPERCMIGDMAVPSSGAKAPGQANIRSRSPSPRHPQSAGFEDWGANSRAQPPQFSASHSRRSYIPGEMQGYPRRPPEAIQTVPVSYQPQFDRNGSPMRHQRARPLRPRSQSPSYTRDPQASLQHALGQPSRHAPRHRARSSSPDRRRSDGHGSIRVLSQTPRISSDTPPAFRKATGGRSSKSTPKTKKEWKEEFQRQKALSTAPNMHSHRKSFRVGEKLTRKNKR